MKYYMIVMAFILTACGKDPMIVTSTVYVPTPASSPVVSEEQSQIDQVVSDENDYRLGLGQTKLTPGLSCTLYTFTGGQYIQNDATHTPTLTSLSQVATFLMAGSFDQADSPISDGMNVLPSALRSIYQNMYMIRCQGQIVVTQTNYYQFDLRSDDGSVLYLDGSRLIDNDGGHGPQTKSGSKYLRRGVHAFRLDYAQSGGGVQALQLYAGGVAIPSSYWYH